MKVKSKIQLFHICKSALGNLNKKTTLKPSITFFCTNIYIFFFFSVENRICKFHVGVWNHDNSTTFVGLFAADTSAAFNIIKISAKFFMIIITADICRFWKKMEI